MILELDTSSRYSKRASLKDSNKVVASKLTEGDVLVAAKELLTEQNIKLDQLDRVTSIPEGPSFTGLRVGSAIANALNFATGNLKDLHDLQFPKYSSPPHIG